MEQFVAHITPEGRTQSVLEHLEGASRLAEQFAGAFGAGKAGSRCGMLHDIGKYSAAFQRRILESGPKTDHSTAGALEAAKEGDLYAAFCISGHHGGLPDGGNRKADRPEGATLMSKLKRIPGKDVPDYSAFSREITAPKPVYPDFLGKSPFADSFFVRLLFSCLVDADYLDTERFMQGETNRGGGDGIKPLLERLSEHIEPLWNASTDINRLRNRLLRACLDAGTGERGLYTLTAPTGSGKTLASLAFALRHAAERGMSRVIYVIPYTNIIEQTAEKFEEILGAENVLEHHSQAEYDAAEEGEDPSGRTKKLSAENWDAPVVVTTSVQFFESLFSGKSSRCRKLHNIANSVLIFDEAQMLPVRYLRPCVAAIAELTSHYGCTAVLCTATQPSLGREFERFLPGTLARELCPEPEKMLEHFRRVRFEMEGQLSIEELAGRLRKHPQALCIVGTRREAQSLYRLLAEEGSFHLSTLMTPEHRRSALKTIRERLSKGQDCRVVSTSLVEAGVDLDFPTVYRAEAGLDSILQAAGRCNRENKRPLEESVVHVFRLDGRPPAMLEMNLAAMRQALRGPAPMDSGEAVTAYFDGLYNLCGEGLDQKRILNAWEKGVDGSTFPFDWVSREFRLIENETRTVYIPLDRGTEPVNRLMSGERTRELFRQAGRHAVQIYPEHYADLYRSGAVLRLDESVSVLADVSLYSRETGLALKAEEGKGLFI